MIHPEKSSFSYPRWKEAGSGVRSFHPVPPTSALSPLLSPPLLPPSPPFASALWSYDRSLEMSSELLLRNLKKRSQMPWLLFPGCLWWVPLRLHPLSQQSEALLGEMPLMCGRWSADRPCCLGRAHRGKGPSLLGRHVQSSD